MLDQKISKGDALHTIAGEDDGKKKLIVISGVFVLIAVVAIAAYIIKSTEYKPIGTFKFKDLTPQQKERIFSSLPKPTAENVEAVKFEDVSEKDMAKVISSLPKPSKSSQSTTSSTLTKEQKNQLFKSLFAKQ